MVPGLKSEYPHGPGRPCKGLVATQVAQSTRASFKGGMAPPFKLILTLGMQARWGLGSHHIYLGGERWGYKPRFHVYLVVDLGC